MIAFFRCIMMWRIYIVRISLCSAYFRFKTKIGTMHFDVSYVKFFRPKNSLFSGAFFVGPLCSRFYMINT